MNEIAESHGFVIVTYGACAGDTYKHATKGNQLKIINCKNFFRLSVNGQSLSGKLSELDHVLTSNGF